MKNSEKKVTNVEIVSEPVIKTFPKGGTIDLGGLKVNATYEGDAAPVEETAEVAETEAAAQAAATEDNWEQPATEAQW